MEAREFRPIPSGEYQLTARFESLDTEERIYGMGQYQQPYLNLKGTDLELAQRNSQASVPFFLSSRGYGFLWNNPAVGRAIFGKNITSFQAVATDILDYWVTAGDTPAQMEEQYAAVAGTVPMMPDFAMGFWQCKLRYQTQEELLSSRPGVQKAGAAHLGDCGGLLPLAPAGRLEVRPHLLAGPGRDDRGAERDGHRADGVHLAHGG